MAEPDPPPSSPSPRNPPTPSSKSHSPATTAVRSYLQPVTSLDSESVDTLKTLLRITIDVRRSTSKIGRIRRGSPGAGALGATLAQLAPRLNEITDRLSEVLKTHEGFPGIYLVSRQFPVFQDVFKGQFNDGGNDPGYNERVHLLEKLMYVAGTLRGHVEMVLEQSAYWRAKLAGEQPTRLARRLNFELSVDPAAEVGGEEVNEAALAAEDSLQRELPSADHSFKDTVCCGLLRAVSVSLPQELQAALTHIWEEQKFTDVDFLVSGQTIPAHKAVLAAQSQYFECMLFGSMREASMSEVVLEDVPVPAFRKVLQFAYTGSVDMENVALQEILEVSSVADRFGFVSLKEALGDQLARSYISMETVLLLLVHSDIYNLQQLHGSCLQFIENRENSVQILRHPSLLHLPEDSLAAVISRDTFVAPEIEILRAVEKWKNHNSKDVGEITKLLGCVRLSEFSSAEQIFTQAEPMGLLDSQTILAGVRVICKPCLPEMKPRGRKESNKNLFTSPNVCFDPSTAHSAIIQPRPHHQRHTTSPPQYYVADSVVKLGEGNVAYRRSRALSSELYPNTMIIALDDLYIINYLNIKGYPSAADDDQMKGKCFSYTVSISRDKKTWLKLFDYSSYACWGAQHLPFPRQATRFIRMDLKWREDGTNSIPLQFSACCFVSDPRPFSFLANGVIAPQYEHDVVTVSWMEEEEEEGEQQMCVALFRQPYSTSSLRFSLECSDEEVSSLDVAVSVGVMESDEKGSGSDSNTVGVSGGGRAYTGGGLQLGAGLNLGGGLQLGAGVLAGLSGAVYGKKRGGTLKNKLRLKEVDGAPLNESIEIEVKEKVVNYLEVAIRKVHCKPPPPAVSTSNPFSLLSSVATTAPAPLVTSPEALPSEERPSPKQRMTPVGDSHGVKFAAEAPNTTEVETSGVGTTTLNVSLPLAQVTIEPPKLQLTAGGLVFLPAPTTSSSGLVLQNQPATATGGRPVFGAPVPASFSTTPPDQHLPSKKGARKIRSQPVALQSQIPSTINSGQPVAPAFMPAPPPAAYTTGQAWLPLSQPQTCQQTDSPRFKIVGVVVRSSTH